MDATSSMASSSVPANILLPATASSGKTMRETSSAQRRFSSSRSTSAAFVSRSASRRPPAPFRPHRHHRSVRGGGATPLAGARMLRLDLHPHFHGGPPHVLHLRPKGDQVAHPHRRQDVEIVHAAQ